MVIYRILNTYFNFTWSLDIYSPRFTRLLIPLSNFLIFASQDKLDLLADVNKWYVEGTFKVVRHPFAQLFSIHGFLGNQQKQVPLAFVLMSRRQTSD